MSASPRAPAGPSWRHLDAALRRVLPGTPDGRDQMRRLLLLHDHLPWLEEQLHTVDADMPPPRSLLSRCRQHCWAIYLSEGLPWAHSDPRPPQGDGSAEAPDLAVGAGAGAAAVPVSDWVANGEQVRLGETALWWLMICSLELLHMRAWPREPADAEELAFVADNALRPNVRGRAEAAGAVGAGAGAARIQSRRAAPKEAQLSTRELVLSLGLLCLQLRNVQPERSRGLQLHLARLLQSAARLIYYAQPAALADEARYAAALPGQRGAAAAAAAIGNEALVRETDLLFRGLYRRVNLLQALGEPIDFAEAWTTLMPATGDAEPAAPAVPGEPQMQRWLLARVDALDTETMVTTFYAHLAQFTVLPGERERAAYVLGGAAAAGSVEIMDAERIVEALRPHDYKRMLTDRARPVEEILASQQPEDRLAREVLLVLVLSHMMPGLYGIEWQRTALCYERRLSERLTVVRLRSSRATYVVQLLGAFRTVHCGRLLRAGSTLEAFAQWALLADPVSYGRDNVVRLCRDMREA